MNELPIYANGMRVEFFDRAGRTRRGRIVGRMSTRAESGKETCRGYLIQDETEAVKSPHFCEVECIFPVDAVTDRPRMH